MSLAESRDRPGLTKASQRLSPRQIWGPPSSLRDSQPPAGFPAAIHAEWAWRSCRAGALRRLGSFPCVIPVFSLSQHDYHYQKSKSFFKNVRFPPNMSFGECLGCQDLFSVLERIDIFVKRPGHTCFFLLSLLL